MKSLLSLALVFGLFALTACNSGSGDPYYASWYDAFGNPCGYGYNSAHPGCDYSQNGLKIQAWQDPFWMQWKRDGQYWMSPSGIWYDPSGFAINSVQNEPETSTDVITQAAEQRDQVVKLAGQSLSERYALSEDSGLRIAKSLDDWANLGRERARTEADVADFSKRLYGISAQSVQVAIDRATETRSLQPFEDLNVDVAAYWGTTPEVSKKILKKWYAGQLSQYGM